MANNISRKHIFISHSSQDNRFAQVLAQELQNRGYEVWFDAYNLDFCRFQSQLEATLANCQAVLILLSAAAIQSSWVKCGIDVAQELEKRTGGMLIVLVLIEQCAVPVQLNGYRCLYFLPGGNHAAQLDLFTEMLEDRSYRQAQPTTEASPAQATQAEQPAERPTTHNRGKFIISGSIHGGTININQAESIVTHNTLARDTDK
ncbi:hypothetical protein KSF_038750 [Reticulibacter mediterranei]|uniref:TIR domain-containing protein n=1 Tax=Reticulibacter mediterranei TaxID=2778369 RepID=A0A8J3N480_9CHLR|nr:toll/interleukin-1 receptor domain-containing protein [Reticulibacter mediterranei]GHO93827.1 hypothetical protein KSF_038750 [Reticulibacter mediterranei]